MGFFGTGGLKHEHRIYDEDFESNEMFRNELEDKIGKLEQLSDDINKLLNKDYNKWDNNDLKEKYFDLLEEANDEVNKSISKLRNIKGDIR